MLRDTLCSFIVVGVWWMLMSYRTLLHPRVVSTLVLALVLLVSLRPYLAGAVALGVLAWALFPVLAHRSRATLVFLGAVTALLAVGVAVQQARKIDQAAHELVYRQMTTRMETLKLLYHEVKPDAPPNHPVFGAGVPVAIVDPISGWILAGLVQEPVAPDVLQVAFTDASIRRVPVSELTLLQSAPLSPMQMLASLGPGVLSFLSGAPGTNDSSSVVWIADALAWDVLFTMAVLGALRARVAAREWLFPASVVLATVVALVSVPGAPGNDNRHRSSQAVPLLVVFAAGLLAPPTRIVSGVGRMVSTATSSPARAPAPANSRTRSPR
jgi:hypothetical protein